MLFNPSSSSRLNTCSIQLASLLCYIILEVRSITRYICSHKARVFPFQSDRHTSSQSQYLSTAPAPQDRLLKRSVRYDISSAQRTRAPAPKRVIDRRLECDIVDIFPMTYCSYQHSCCCLWRQTWSCSKSVLGGRGAFSNEALLR